MEIIVSNYKLLPNDRSPKGISCRHDDMTHPTFVNSIKYTNCGIGDRGRFGDDIKESPFNGYEIGSSVEGVNLLGDQLDIEFRINF